MTRNYVAFDLEIAKELFDFEQEWRSNRPLGITCAAALPCDSKQVITWCGGKDDGSPADKMSLAEVKEVLRELWRFVENGYTLLTWNGLGFDFNILAEESGLHEVCKKLALDHVDMMFHVFRDRGYPVALDKAARGSGIPGKPRGMSGALAPRLWANGRHREVLEYVASDVSTTLRLALLCEGIRQLKWITRRGGTASMNLPHGWLTVRDALQLPDPDTSWMDDPIPQEEFTAWLRL
ncbi:MAG TPA: ribonuclease H-like domain-containing protein [Planctomycetota bacterium]|nr:ribonuclease H-like domain-containing protein [Planctomycetota bacterium]